MSSSSVETLTAAMDNTVYRLRADLSSAMDESSTWQGALTSFLGGASSARDAIVQNLAKTGERIEDLHTRLRQQVMSGTLVAPKWFGVADTLGKEIVTQSGYAAQHSFSSLYNQVAVQSAKDIAQIAEDAAPKLYVLAALAVVALLALAAFRLAPAINTVAGAGK
jgi:hypothetical protein